MTPMPENLDPLTQQAFEALHAVPPRDPQQAARGRAAFLAQAEGFRAEAQSNEKRAAGGIFLQQAVSKTRKARLNPWTGPLNTLFRRKEHAPMFTTLTTLMVIMTLVLGGGGATAAAAQNSLPDQPLYSLKTWTEQTRAGWTHDSDQQMRLALELANRRASEINAMLAEGKTPPEAVQAQLRIQLDQALQLCAGQAEPDAVQSLERIREQLHEQENHLAQVHSATSAGEAVREQVHEMLQEHLRLVDAGLNDPVHLREHLRNGSPNETPGEPEHQQQGPAGHETEPQHQQQGPQNNPQGAPTEHPALMQTQTSPAVHEPDHSNSQNPWTDSTPTPGSSYGPGPGDGAGERRRRERRRARRWPAPRSHNRSGSTRSGRPIRAWTGGRAKRAASDERPHGMPPSRPSRGRRAAGAGPQDSGGMNGGRQQPEPDHGHDGDGGSDGGGHHGGG